MSSSFEHAITISRPAGADYSAAIGVAGSGQYRFGVTNPNAATAPSPSIPGVYGSSPNITIDPGNALVNTVAGGDCDYVIVGKAKAGQPIECAIAGRIPIILGGSVNAGDRLSSDATGAAITHTASNHILGVALSAGVAGDEIDMIFSPRGEA